MKDDYICRKAREWMGSTRSSIWMMKYVPFLAAVLLTAHCGFLLAGINLHIVEHIMGFSVSATLMFLCLSYHFRFCPLHKFLIVYDALMQLCICLQEHDVFGGGITIARWVMFIVGLIVCLSAAVKVSVSKCV